MPYRQQNVSDMYRRALAALDAEFTDIPANSVGADAAAGLRAQLAIIEQKGGAQAGFSGAGQAGTAVRSVARRSLYDFMKALAQTANTISRKIPGFNENFPSPAGKNDQELLSEARAAAPVAVAEQEKFVKFGLEEEFVVSGAELIEAFEASFEATDEAAASGAAATGSKREAFDAADEFFDDLDRYIRNRYRDQSAKIHAWKVASRIERSPKNDDPPPTS